MPPPRAFLHSDVSGTFVQVGGPRGLCAFPPCPNQAVAVVRLLVDGWPVEMQACQGHRNWLTGYVREVDAVQLVEVITEESGRLPRTGQS